MHLKYALDYFSAFLQSLKYKLVGIPSKSLYAEVIFFVFFWKPISSLQVCVLFQNIYQMQRMLKELFYFLGDKKKVREMGGSVIGTSFLFSCYIAPWNYSVSFLKWKQDE